MLARASSLTRRAQTSRGSASAEVLANIYDVSVDFASDRYDANSAAGYDANLDANSYGCDCHRDFGQYFRHLSRT